MNTQGVLSGAASGAALGTEVYPGYGTAIGAIAGALMGALGSGSSKGGTTPPIDQQTPKLQPTQPLKPTAEQQPPLNLTTPKVDIGSDSVGASQNIPDPQDAFNQLYQQFYGAP